MELTDEQKFDALKLRYNDHVELLRFITKLDVQIFSGYITLQLALGAWLATNRPEDLISKIGIILIDFTLGTIAAKLLYNDYLRRKEIVAILRNLCEALGFRKTGYYLPDKAIDIDTQSRTWWWWYLLGIISGVVGIIFITFGGIQITK